jgi:hypothetical protein
MILRRLLLSLLGITALSAAPVIHAQSATGAGTTSEAAQKDAAWPGPAKDTVRSPVTRQESVIAYHRPTEREKISNFAFDAFGPYPILTATASAAIQQAYGTPPEWGGGSDAFATRFGSNYGIQFITTSTRYVLAEAFREDTVYYRCSCSGFFPRFQHALISSVTARRGDDGHRVFSLAALGAPYAGTMSAALGWYPSRYEPMDGFRMGNYNLAAAAAQNFALEFIYGGPHTFLSRVHIPGMRGRAAPDPNP